MRSGRIIFILAIILAMGATSGGYAGSSGASAATPRLRLQRGTLDLARPVAASGAADPFSAVVATYSIVQFSHPTSAGDVTVLEASGLKVLEYIPEYAYLVRGDAGAIQRLQGLPDVYGSVEFTLADKIDPALLRLTRKGTPVHVSVVPWASSETAALDTAVGAAGIDLTQPQDGAALLTLARLPAVRWIGTSNRPRLQNSNERQIMHVNQAWAETGLYGSGQIVAVTDTGLDTGNLATLNPDFASRIAATYVLSAGQQWDDSNGHGTHVAGSVLGSGMLSGADPASHAYQGSFAGVAPEARLVVQAFEADNATGEIVGLGDDLYPVLQQGYSAGARIASNSWGDYTGPISDTAATFGGYTYWSQRADQFIWEHPDATVLFAAGNNGKDGVPDTTFGFCTGGNGVVDPDSLLAPATAKNVIAVGASESTAVGGYSGYPWMFLGQECLFTAAPIATDPVANNVNGMAAFSARGPVDDGRTKPDVVAPGSNVVSVHSTAASNPNFLFHESNGNYMYLAGTSMATPLVAGMTALLREWMINNGTAAPSAAAIKALLLNTTATMSIGQYGTGITQELPGTTPNSINGWGRADTAWMAQPAPFGVWVDDHSAGLATGQSSSYSHSVARPLTVLTSTQPLRVMLTWSDPPASLSAAQQLVNDLDLVVTGPDGTQYRPNNGAGDHLNNVEGLIISNPQPGQYTVSVSALNVPMATQPYALAVAGPINPGQGGGGTPTPTPTTTATTMPTITPVLPTITLTPLPTVCPTPTQSISTPTTTATNTPVTPTATTPPTTTATATNTPVTPTATTPPTTTATNTPVTPTSTPTRTPTSTPVALPYKIFLPGLFTGGDI